MSLRLHFTCPSGNQRYTTIVDVITLTRLPKEN